MASGQNINEIKDMDAVKEKLTTLLPQITTFWGSENDWNQFMAAGDFAWPPTGRLGRALDRQGVAIAFVVPEEGAIGWLDGLSVPASSTHPERPMPSSTGWSIRPSTPSGMPKARRPRRMSRPPRRCPKPASTARCWRSAVVAKVQFMRPVSDENREAYLKLWQDLKAAQ